jgi:RNA polymerase sigma factor (sigma-70 family)
MDVASPLTKEQADALWQECLPEAAWLISFLLREVGLPAPKLPRPTLPIEDVAKQVAQTYQILSKDDGLLPDVLQTVFEDYWRLFTRADSDAWLASPRGCLFRIVQRDTWHARNAALRTRRKVVSIEDRLGLPQEIPYEEASSEETTVSHERLALIKEFLSLLREEERQILLAKLERSYEPLARSLGIASGTIRTRACRLWARFKRFVESRAQSSKRVKAA